MYGGLERFDDGRWQLRFTRRFRHPREKVWRAVTEPEHLARWFPTTIDGERAAGARLRFAFPAGEGPPFEGEMLVFDPPSVMELRWGPDIIRLELQAAGEGTVLTLVDILEERGKAARDGAGWHVCLDALTGALRGESDGGRSVETWNDVHPTYVERFGPQAATIGPPGAAT